jgi:hypothetical protein
MRRKVAPSTMQGAPSADPPEASPRQTAPPCRQKGSSKASPGPRTRCGRTSTLGPPASDPCQTRSACNGKQHHRPCRSSHGCKRQGQTTDAIDTKAHESQSRGRSQTLLYNQVRPHSSLGYLTPAEFAAKLTVNDAAPASATGRDAAVDGASAPRPVAAPSLQGHSKAQETPGLSS